MTKENEADPSIEEILASIRQIISDDDEPGAAEEGAGADADPIPKNQDSDTVLELTQDMEAGDEFADALAVVTGEAAPESEPEEETPPPPPKANPKADIEPAPEKEDVVIDFMDEKVAETDFSLSDYDVPAEGGAEIFSDTASSATLDAFSKLAENVAISRSRGLADAGVTLEEIVKDLLRPMLRQWVHENLPRLVESLVEKELEKLARRARDE